MHRAVYWFVLACLVFTLPCLQAQTATEAVLHEFCAQQYCPDGFAPGSSSLIQARDGNFYGTTGGGGPTLPNMLNGGTMFDISSSGTFNQLASFHCTESVVCADGNTPSAALLQGGDGNFYGTTALSDGNGDGIVFKMTPAGAVTILHTFCLQTGCPDGEHPQAQLIEGSDGDFYGTTTTYIFGASSGDTATGTIFKITSSGTLTTLFTFADPATQGAYPSGNLLQGSDGNFYGTTIEGGASSGGTFFQLTPAGTFTSLYNFGGEAGAGSLPLGGLVEGADGNFYGTTSAGGAHATVNSYAGTVYKITPAGVLTTLYSFCAQASGPACLDGYEPLAGLFLANDGNFYGTTFYGGTGTPSGMNDLYTGTLFQITPAGAHTMLYSFLCTQTVSGGNESCPDGEQPEASVVQGSDLNFYGTTADGGVQSGDEYGVIYKLAVPSVPGLAPVNVYVNNDGSGGLTGPVFMSVYVSFAVLNAFSTTMQQCYGYSTFNGVTTALGLIPGKLTDGQYSGGSAFTPTAAGTYTFTLTCGGMESGASLALTATPLSTTTYMLASPNPASVGQQVAFFGNIHSGSNGRAPVNGTLDFDYDNAVVASTGAPQDFIFDANTANLTPGTYAITPKYLGSPAYTPSSGPPYTVTLTAAPTVTTITATPNTVTPPASVTLQATVKRAVMNSSGTPVGSVTFLSGGNVLGSAAVNSSGVATFTGPTTGLPAGKYHVQARYNGDVSDVASTSAATTVTVQ
jgi:uncharacterized repeat protein (TIGR03803 family)